MGCSFEAVATGAFVRSIYQRHQHSKFAPRPPKETVMTETTVYTTPAAPAENAVRLPAAGTYELDPVHTSVGFIARHLMVAKVRGQFTEFTGSIVVADDSLQSWAEATIHTASISTWSDQRDGHLRSADFFDSDRYPTMTFRSTEVLAGDRGTFAVQGQLTIKDVTRPVQLDVEYHGLVTDPWGQQRIALTATVQIDRRDFGLAWNAPLEGGGFMIGNTVKIEIEAEAVGLS
jgi:polyisoprenoid-binding protein YceI